MLWIRKYIPQFFLLAENTPDHKLLAYFTRPASVMGWRGEWKAQKR